MGRLAAGEPDLARQSVRQAVPPAGDRDAAEGVRPRGGRFGALRGQGPADLPAGPLLGGGRAQGRHPPAVDPHAPRTDGGRGVAAAPQRHGAGVCAPAVAAARAGRRGRDAGPGALLHQLQPAHAGLGFGPRPLGGRPRARVGAADGGGGGGDRRLSRLQPGQLPPAAGGRSGRRAVLGLAARDLRGPRALVGRGGGAGRLRAARSRPRRARCPRPALHPPAGHPGRRPRAPAGGSIRRRCRTTGRKSAGCAGKCAG